MSKPDGSQPEKPFTMADLIEATGQLEKSSHCPKCDKDTLRPALKAYPPPTRGFRVVLYCNACGHMEEQ